MSTLRTFSFTQEAYIDYNFFKERDSKIAAKIKSLILSIMDTPFSGIGKPEALRFKLSGCWSRRINQQHRLVYRVIGDELQILSCRYHYEQ